MEWEHNMLDAVVLASHVFVMYSGSMFLTDRLGSELSTVFAIIIIVVTISVLWYLLGHVIAEVRESIPILSNAGKPKFWNDILWNFFIAQGHYMIYGAKYKKAYLDQKHRMYNFLKPTFETEVRQDQAKRAKTNPLLSKTGRLLVQKWVKEIGTSMREGENYLRWLEDCSVEIEKSSFDQLIQRDWALFKLPDIHEKLWLVAFARALRIAASHHFSLLCNPILSIEVPIQAVPTLITLNEDKTLKEHTKEDDVIEHEERTLLEDERRKQSEIVTRGVSYFEQFFYSLSTPKSLCQTIQSVSNNQWNGKAYYFTAQDGIEGGRNEYKVDKKLSKPDKVDRMTTPFAQSSPRLFTKMNAYASESGYSSSLLVRTDASLGSFLDSPRTPRTPQKSYFDGSEEEENTYGQVHEHDSYLLQVGEDSSSSDRKQTFYVKTMDFSTYLSFTDVRGGVQILCDVSGTDIYYPCIGVIWENDDFAMVEMRLGIDGMRRCNELSPLLEDMKDEEEVDIIITSHLVPKAKICVYGELQMKDLSGKWWPVFLSKVDRNNGRYYVCDRNGIEGSQPVLRDAIKPRRNYGHLDDELVVGRIWPEIATSEKEEILLIRQDKKEEFVVEEQFIVKEQIEWFQSRIVTAPIAVQGEDMDSTWVAVAFADGSVDLYRGRFDAVRGFTTHLSNLPSVRGCAELVHRLWPLRPTKHIFITPNGKNIWTFSSTDAILWDIPEDKENAVSRVVYQGESNFLLPQQPHLVDGTLQDQHDTYLLYPEELVLKSGGGQEEGEQEEQERGTRSPRFSTPTPPPSSPSQSSPSLNPFVIKSFAKKLKSSSRAHKGKRRMEKIFIPYSQREILSVSSLSMENQVLIIVLFRGRDGKSVLAYEIDWSSVELDTCWKGPVKMTIPSNSLLRPSEERITNVEWLGAYKQLPSVLCLVSSLGALAFYSCSASASSLGLGSTSINRSFPSVQESKNALNFKTRNGQVDLETILSIDDFVFLPRFSLSSNNTLSSDLYPPNLHRSVGRSVRMRVASKGIFLMHDFSLNIDVQAKHGKENVYHELFERPSIFLFKSWKLLFSSPSHHDESLTSDWESLIHDPAQLSFATEGEIFPGINEHIPLSLSVNTIPYVRKEVLFDLVSELLRSEYDTRNFEYRGLRFHELCPKAWFTDSIGKLKDKIEENGK
jgi:hypothetical protein